MDTTGSEDFADLGRDFHQEIYLNGKEHAHTIHGFEVRICASKASSVEEACSGSNKVKISTITNQNWDQLTHHGQIVASNNHYLCYGLEGRNGYVLRLIRQGTNGRALLKGFVGAVVDVAFCHANSNLLACVDQGGNLYLWDLDKFKDDTQMQTEQALKIILQRSSTADEVPHRLVWSPHIPLQEGEEDEQEICTIVLTHGADIEVLDVHEIFSTYPSGMKVRKEQFHCSCYSIKSAHEGNICDLSLSPDGTVLATVGEDGHLRFWQVNLDSQNQEESPKCLHDFIPHNGAPVTRLIFCDNRVSQDPGNQYWRFLITAANNNTNIKIWCAVNWKCLQTIRLLPLVDEQGSIEPHITLGLDLSASYLVVTDSNRKAVLVLQLSTSPAIGDASVISVTEYLLTQPILSFAVAGAARLPPSTDREDFSGEESEDEDTTVSAAVFDSRRDVVLLKLHCVHTRSMQELLVRFEPPDIYGVPPSKTEEEGGDASDFAALANTTAAPSDTLLSIEMQGSGLPELKFPSAEVVINAVSLPAEVVNDTQSTTSPVSQLSSGIAPIATDCGQSGTAQLTSEVLDSSQSKASPVQLPGDGATRPAPFQSLPPLNTFSASPKLLTPSEFTSPVKVELASHPLLSPASILASAAADQLEGTEKSANELGTVGELVKDTNSISSASHPILSISSTQDTLTSVSSNFDTSAVGPSDSVLASFCVEEDEVEEEPVGELEESTVQNGGVLKAEDVPLPVETSSEDDEMPSAGDTKRAFESIMELIDGDISKAASLSELKPSSFDNFTELLINPEKLLEEEKKIQSQEEYIARKEDSPGVHPSPVNRSDVPTAVLDVLKSDPPSDASVGEEVGVVAEWPDIEGVEVPRVSSLQGSGEDSAEATYSAKRAVSNEFLCGDNPLPSTGLLMPSALTGLEVDDGIEISRQVPDLLDKEASMENLKAEGGVLKTKKAKKRSRRGKKRASSSLGVMEFSEVQSHSDGDIAQVNSGVDLTSTASNPNLTSSAVSSDNTSAALSDIKQLVLDQNGMLFELRETHNKKLQVLQEQIIELKTSFLDEHMAGLSEMRLEQPTTEQRLDSILKDKQALDKQKQDRLITTLSSTLTTAVNAKMDKLIRTEIKNNVLPVVQQSVTSFQEKLLVAVADRLSSTDSAMKEGIRQLIASKGLPDAVGSAMLAALQHTLPAVCEQVFKSSVLPSFERSCQEMFHQIDGSFQRGTIEFLSQLQEKQQQRESTLHYLLSSMENVQSVVGKSLEASSPDQLQALIRQEVAKLPHQVKDVLTETIVEVVRTEIQVNALSQDARHREEIKGQLQKLIQSKSYNSAFELALSTSDLQLVTFMCQQVDPDVIFYKSPSLLTQPVLLSLIQQLSVNLEEDLELKLRYLDQSLLSLDVKSEVTKNHMVRVIKQLSVHMSQLQERLQSADGSGTNPIIKQVKRLLMVSQHLCS